MKQRYNECLLAATCAVSGQDYETASDLFVELHGQSWWRAIMADRIQELMAFLDYIAPGMGGKYALALKEWQRQFATNNRISSASAYDLSGKGIVVIQPSDGVESHAMAFDNGAIYDSAWDQHFASLDECLKARYPGWTVREVFHQEG